MEKQKKINKRVNKLLVKSIRLLGCAGVGAVGVAIDAPALFTIALAKSPVLLWKGWKRNIINMESCAMEGTCPWPLCIPMAAAMLLVWPLHVATSIGSALVYGFAKGLNGAVIAYKEKSIACGMKQVIAAISEYDEYTNDVTALREGSCFPRPAYHCHKESPEHPHGEKQEPETGNTQVIRELQMGKLVEYLTSKQARMRARSMIEEDVLNKPLVTAVSWTLLHFLLDSSDAELERKRDDDHGGVVEYDALEILEYQIRDAKLQELEELYLDSFVLGDEEDLEEIEPTLDPIRKATMEGFGRRIRGIASFVSGSLEFRRQYTDYVRAVIAASQDMISFEET